MLQLPQMDWQSSPLHVLHLNDEHIHTQLNVYMWIYLRNGRIVLIMVKSSVGKQGRKVLAIHVNNPSGPPPLPELFDARKRTHTHKHARTYMNQMPYSQHPRDYLQTVSKQTNPNLQQ